MSRELVVNVVGAPVRVVIHHEDAVELEGGRLRGVVRCSDAVMHIDGRVAPHMVAVTFLHELLHFLDFELLDGELSEAQIKALATGLASVLGEAVLELLGVTQNEG